MGIDIALRSVIMGLESIHVLGRDAETLSSAINVTKKILAAVEAAKEGGNNDHYDEPRKNA